MDLERNTVAGMLSEWSIRGLWQGIYQPGAHRAHAGMRGVHAPCL